MVARQMGKPAESSGAAAASGGGNQAAHVAGNVAGKKDSGKNPV